MRRHSGMRVRAYFVIFAVVVLINAAAWTASYRAATAPSPEEMARAAQSAVVEAPSPVTFQRDGFYEHSTLTGDCAICAGPWRYLQTGTELTPFGGGPAFFAPEHDDSNWRVMSLPQNRYLAGLNYHGVMWFRQRFTADPSWQGRAVRLHFDGVDYATTVWLNGQQVGEHTGAFQPFDFDVSGLLDYDAENVLVVRVHHTGGAAWLEQAAGGRCAGCAGGSGCPIAHDAHPVLRRSGRSCGSGRRRAGASDDQSARRGGGHDNIQTGARAGFGCWR